MLRIGITDPFLVDVVYSGKLNKKSLFFDEKKRNEFKML